MNNNNNNNNNKSTDTLSSDLVVKPSSTQSIDKEVLPNKDTKTKDKHTLITIIGGEDEIEQMTISQLKNYYQFPENQRVVIQLQLQLQLLVVVVVLLKIFK